MQGDNIFPVWDCINLEIYQQLQHFFQHCVSLCVLSSSKLYGACWMCSLMPGSADSSVGDMQAAEQADCWSHWPGKSHSREDEGLRWRG